MRQRDWVLRLFEIRGERSDLVGCVRRALGTWSDDRIGRWIRCDDVGANKWDILMMIDIAFELFYDRYWMQEEIRSFEVLKNYILLGRVGREFLFPLF